MAKKIIVIGSGFAGLSAATCLAHKGYDVSILEKNAVPGGRARKFKAQGFTFDMGPSWYWMPDLFDSFFADFNKQTSDYYSLKRLDPGYRIFFDKEDVYDAAYFLKFPYGIYIRFQANLLRKPVSLLVYYET